jgi:hypothetical protein
VTNISAPNLAVVFIKVHYGSHQARLATARGAVNADTLPRRYVQRGNIQLRKGKVDETEIGHRNAIAEI